MNFPICRTVLLGVLLLPVVQLSGQTTRTLVGHTAAVNCAIYTADQRYIVTAAADQVIKIWDAKTGKEVSTLVGHTGPVLSLANSPDGSVIISGAADNSIRMWDVPRKDPTRIFAAAGLGARGIAVSRNGQWAVSFAAKGGQIWNLRSGKSLFALKGQPAVNAVATRPDNNQIASGDARGEIRLWSPFDGKSRGVIGGHEGRVSGLVFHPNSQRLVSTGASGQLKVWQLPLPAERGFSGHTVPVRAVTLTSNGQLAVTGSDDGVRIVNVANGQIVRKLDNAAV